MSAASHWTLPPESIVVFEDLYYDDDLIISHNDINDEEQTVEIKKPKKTPDTGYITNSLDNSISQNSFVLISVGAVVVIGLYSTTKIIRRKKISFNK